MADTLHDQVWDMLRNAATIGAHGLTVAVLASSLGCTPEAVLESVMDDMLTHGAEFDAPPLYCQPDADDGPRLCPRRFPG
jgi:hypothetical protein